MRPYFIIEGKNLLSLIPQVTNEKIKGVLVFDGQLVTFLRTDNFVVKVVSVIDGYTEEKVVFASTQFGELNKLNPKYEYVVFFRGNNMEIWDSNVERVLLVINGKML